MTLRQRLLKMFYPILMKISSGQGKNIRKNHAQAKPKNSFFDLTAVVNNNTIVSFANFKGMYVLIVNTASDCGFTPQLAALESLRKQYAEKLIILGFPSNDFKEQEKGTDDAIASFCQINYGTGFPIMQKTVVVKKENQHPVYQWLSDANQNGWNEQAPAWNFCKYLINPSGVLTHYFPSATDPLDKVIVENIV